MSKTKTPKTHWNYRILAHQDINGLQQPLPTVTLIIHEVYYTGGKPDGYSLEGSPVIGASIAEIEWTCNVMSAYRAFKHLPPLIPQTVNATLKAYEILNRN